MATGYVGILTVELHFPESGSLKGKRKHVKSAKAQLHERFGASVAEVDHHDLWQRSTLAVACATREHSELQSLLDAVERYLGSQEWELMRAHPVVGAQIVEKMEFLGGTIDIVRHHHESWNGKGYPDGLKGEDIPLTARIVTVADSFDAMTTDRPYRSALSLDEAVSRLEDSSGIQFDKHLVEIFVKYIREKGRDLALVDAAQAHPLEDV